MPDFAVHDYGTDSSGRTIWMTAYMHEWIEDLVTAIRFRPTVIQGAFMTRDGGGAKDSSGYHDQAGCVDFRTRDLTTAQVDTLVNTARRRGAGAWRRDLTGRHGGMDPHCHMTLGSDYPLSAGARISWGSYVSGGDGLAGPYDDYEWRPSPLVLTPPEVDDMPAYKDWDADSKAQLAADVAKAILDTEKVDKDGKVSVRQGINQARNKS